MAKTMISADPGALMKVAEVKGIASFKALSEKTGSDRKTLRAINEGRPVKEMTLQGIADTLRVPISHLRKEQTISPLRSLDRPPGLREIVLQPLNAKLLRELIEALDLPGHIEWILKVDQIPTDIAAQLLSFEKLLEEWWEQLMTQDKAHGLKNQLAKISVATDVENHIQKFSAANLKLFGANHIWWSKHFFGDEPNPNFAGGLDYDFLTVGVIAIEPKNVTYCRHRIDHGEEPPALFDERPPPPEVRWVRVDGVVVYKRSNPNGDPLLDEASGGDR